jgi:hypothetical protein
MITGCIPGCNIARLFNLAAISSLLITGKDVGIISPSYPMISIPHPTNNGIYGVSIPLSQQAATNLTTSKTITVQIPKPDERKVC